jgi:hypothetical protein
MKGPRVPSRNWQFGERDEPYAYPQIGERDRPGTVGYSPRTSPRPMVPCRTRNYDVLHDGSNSVGTVAVKA